MIRQVGPGQSGEVETIVGSGTAGSRDGTLATARFRRPQGLVLDRNGNLWVADAGNHTIRQVRIFEGEVITVAGQAGQQGDDDGRGPSARFRSPVGVALEVEPLAAQLARQNQGGVPPPVSILVADAGNGLIRRVHEDGTVETLVNTVSQSAALSFAQLRGSGPLLDPLRFDTPMGIAVGPFGRIFVSEPSLNRVTAVLLNGDRVRLLSRRHSMSRGGLRLLIVGKSLLPWQTVWHNELVLARR